MKKNSCGSKIPHFPHNIFNGPSLILLDFLQFSLAGNFRFSYPRVTKFEKW